MKREGVERNEPNCLSECRRPGRCRSRWNEHFEAGILASSLGVPVRVDASVSRKVHSQSLSLPLTNELSSLFVSAHGNVNEHTTKK